MTQRGAMGGLPVLFDAELERVVALQRQAVRARRPGGWESRMADDVGEGWAHDSGATVIWSCWREKDGRVWLHASMAHPDRIPSWEELKKLHYWMFSPERYAYQVLPPSRHYVNVNPHVLHLWGVIDGPEPLPEFLKEGGMI